MSEFIVSRNDDQRYNRQLVVFIGWIALPLIWLLYNFIFITNYGPIGVELLSYPISFIIVIGVSILNLFQLVHKDGFRQRAGIIMQSSGLVTMLFTVSVVGGCGGQATANDCPSGFGDANINVPILAFTIILIYLGSIIEYKSDG